MFVMQSHSTYSNDLGSFVLKGSMNYLDGISQLNTSPAEIMHEVLIAVKQENLDLLRNHLMERSSPRSDKFQKWLSPLQINKLTSNVTAYNRVMSWLHSNSAKVVWASSQLNYILAEAPVKSWECMLNTEFYVWNDTRSKEPKLLHRAHNYSVPANLSEYITAVFQAADITPIPQHNHVKWERESSLTPNPISKPSAKSENISHIKVIDDDFSKQSDLLSRNNLVTVQFLNSLYKIDSNIGTLVPSLKTSTTTLLK